jgi:hypothetical protein
MGFSLELQRKKKWKKGLDETQREREKEWRKVS